MKEQIGPRALLARLKRNLGPYSEELPELPLLAYRVLQGLEHQTLAIRWRSDELEQLRLELRHHQRRLRGLLGGTTLIFCGTWLLIFGPGYLLTPPFTLSLALTLVALGAYLLLRR